MSLSVLPNELIQLIAEHLVFDCDVNALSKTNRRLYVLLNRYSYLVNISRFGSSALPWLCHHGCTPLVRMMLDEGAPLDVFGDQDLHPMCLAASEGHADVVEIFLQRGVDPNAISAGALMSCALMSSTPRPDLSPWQPRMSRCSE
jgi:ankyrin repeat protein